MVGACQSPASRRPWGAGPPARRRRNVKFCGVPAPAPCYGLVTVWESPESGPWAHRRRRGGGPGALDVHRAALAPFYAAALDDGCKRFLLASTRPTILRSILKR